MIGDTPETRPPNGKVLLAALERELDAARRGLLDAFTDAHGRAFTVTHSFAQQGGVNINSRMSDVRGEVPTAIRLLQEAADYYDAVKAEIARVKSGVTEGSNG